MKQFTVTHTLTAEQISDLLCNALEGGSNYWYHIEQIVSPTSWEFDSEPKRQRGKHWLHDYPFNPGGALLIRDKEDNEQLLMRLDTSALERGLTILAEKYPNHVADVLASNADATTGDVFLQCCLFGDVIYG